MSDKKYLIIAITLIIAIAIILVLLKMIPNEEEKIQETPPKYEDFEQKFVRGDFKATLESEYYTINECITSFLNAITYKANDVVFDMIDKTYAEQNNIDNKNICSKFKISDKYKEYEAAEIYNVDLTETSRVYLVYGNVMEKNSETGKKIPFDAIVNVDFSNLAYSIVPYEVGTLNKETLDIEALSQNFKEIKQNQNNKFNRFVTNDKMKAVKLFTKYLTETLYYPDDAYNMLDEEYRNKRFGSIEKYKQYITENKEHIRSLVVDSYLVTKKEGYTEFEIMDNYGNMYIFNVSNILNYTVKMDDYTIETEEFIREYTAANVQNKMSLNIGKFFSMINAKDYESAYSCLAEGFKKNYFPTVEHFKKYVEENFFEANKLEGVSFESEGETYMLTLKISDYRGRDTKVIEKTIIMQLGEGTDFVMSFNVD